MGTSEMVSSYLAMNDRILIPSGMVLFTQPPPNLGPDHAAWTNAKPSAYYGTERGRWIITGVLWVMLVVVVEAFLTRVINVPSERFTFRIIFDPFVAAFALLFSLALPVSPAEWPKFICAFPSSHHYTLQVHQTGARPIQREVC